VLKQLALVSAISLTMMMVMMVMVTGYENFAEDVKMMLGRKPNIVFRISWLVLSPLTMLVSQTQTYGPPSTSCQRSLFAGAAKSRLSRL